MAGNVASASAGTVQPFGAVRCEPSERSVTVTLVHPVPPT